jgi:uncharacterized membrane protein
MNDQQPNSTSDTSAPKALSPEERGLLRKAIAPSMQAKREIADEMAEGLYRATVALRRAVRDHLRTAPNKRLKSCLDAVDCLSRLYVRAVDAARGEEPMSADDLVAALLNTKRRPRR